MKRILITLCLSFFALATLGQTYPSPTYQNLTILGTGTAPTHSFGDASTDLATDAFVQTQGLHFTSSSGIGITTNTTLTASQLNNWAEVQATGLAVTMPAISTTLAGQTFSFISNGFSYTIATAGTDGIVNFAGAGGVSSITSSANENITLVSNGPTSGTWYIVHDGLSPQNKITQFGTPANLVPSVVQQTSTTANTTVNSTTITVASGSGIQQYQGIYGSFVQSCVTADQGVTQDYVVSVSGTTVTMSCPATSTNTGAAVQFGQNRFYGVSSAIQANNVGATLYKGGSLATGNSAGWLNQIATGMDYQSTASMEVTSNAGGGYAGVFGARTSDTSGGALAFPLQSYWLGDTWGSAGYGGENLYLQDTLRSATSGKTPHFQFEQTITNQWASVGEDPYTINQTNQTIAHRLNCGNGASTVTAGVYNCSAAIDIVPNPNAFNNGIVISNGALVTNGNALSMPLNTAVTWFSGSNTPSAYITSLAAATLDFGFPAVNGAGIKINNVLTTSSTSPGVSSGFGTGATVYTANGTAAFGIHVGTSPGSTGTLSMPSGASNGWACDGVDLSQNNPTQFYLRMTATSPSSVTFGMFSSSGTSSNFVAGDYLSIKCTGY